MRVFKLAAAGAAAASMIAATGAIAAQPVRSAAAMPTTAQSVPINNFRTATPLKRKSSQAEDGAPILGYVLGAVVLAGTVAATIVGSDNSSDYVYPSSPG